MKNHYVIFRKSIDDEKREKARFAVKKRYKTIICPKCGAREEILSYIRRIYCSGISCRNIRKKNNNKARITRLKIEKTKVFPKYKIESCGHLVQLHFNPLKGILALKSVRCQKLECR